jgi:hypothetical protein
MLVHVKGGNSQGDVVLELGSEPLLNDVIAALEKKGRIMISPKETTWQMIEKMSHILA